MMDGDDEWKWLGVKCSRPILLPAPVRRYFDCIINIVRFHCCRITDGPGPSGMAEHAAGRRHYSKILDFKTNYGISFISHLVSTPPHTVGKGHWNFRWNVLK
ncbi:hypothetical protein DW886_00070 [Enterocloster aldenensis]|nr:hypothetical protein DW886_00070 [Enterocloster aldenensis]